MKRIALAFCLLLFLALPVHAQEYDYCAGAGGAAACSDSSCSGFLLCQNFQTATTGYDNSESWSETVGTGGIVEAADTTATVLRGTQQLKIYAGNSGQISYDSSPSFAENSTTYYHWLMQVPALPGSEYSFFYIRSSGAAICTIALKANGTLGVTAAGGSQQTHGTAMSVDTKYHVWATYTVGTGANASCKVNVSTTGTKPGTGEVDSNNGTATTSPSLVRIVLSAQQTMYLDQLLVRTTEMANVCD